MFLKIIKKLTLTLPLMFIIPLNIFAYSEYIIAGGDTVGIKLNTDGIMIVGSYEINGHNNLIETGLKNGDLILEINNNKIDNIDSMVSIIKNCNCNKLSITYKRDNKTFDTTLPLYRENDNVLTGLYVKDSITGVGTLTYIDPNTKLFGVLGHEITDSNGNILISSNGSIFDSKVVSITRSSNGNPGEKNAILYSDNINGNIFENTNKGIFGIYTNNIISDKLYKVATIDEIKLGNATILPVIDNPNIDEFNINILSIKNTKNKLKNIEFEITDNTLLEKTGGIVQGMSGSPIIQDNNIIGAVTHVVVDNPKRGYGILIVNMLEEAEN